MIEKWIAAEGGIFAAILFGSIALVALIEGLAPRRNLDAPKGLRWSSNIIINVIDIFAVWAVIPVLTVGMGVLVAEHGWGLLNLVSVPIVVSVVIALLAIDLSRYVQHYLLHRVAPLWRIHLVHHTDQDYDFSTGLRFHPLESLFTVAYDVAIILLLGPPIVAVLIYETIKLVWSVVAHANVKVPLPVDRAVRRILVTPDLHRIHHSAAPGETNSNFGAVSPVWDRLFGTYVDQPAHGHKGMTIGLPDCRDVEYLKLSNMLLQPFRNQRP